MSGEREPIVQDDAYVGDSLATTSKFIDTKGFRYTNTTNVDRLQVRTMFSN